MCRYSLSTLSNEVPICEKSQSRFCVRICTENIGKKGKKMLSTMTEIMLPKLPEAAILMCFIRNVHQLCCYSAAAQLSLVIEAVVFNCIQSLPSL